MEEVLHNCNCIVRNKIIKVQYKCMCIIIYIFVHGYLCKYVTLIAVCPVKGQIRLECASHPDCHRTCNDTGPIACPRVCIPNGCQCPRGTVIDEEKNECVTPNQCLGMHYITTYR